MAFHPPFDQAQRQLAVKLYLSMRRNVKALRITHPPRSPEEKKRWDLYKFSIQQFGEQLLKPKGKIDADLMNDLSGRILDAFIGYMDIRKTDD